MATKKTTVPTSPTFDKELFKRSVLYNVRTLYRKTMESRIPCMTSIDTALALADVISASYDQSNTHLVDINH